jgi:polyisoprenoid-binding protein YceI
MKKLVISSLFIMTFLSFVVMGTSQTKLTAKRVNVEISGTSTLHDWTMKGSGGSCSADFTIDGSGKLSNVQTMSFSIPVKVLKSGKGAMDKNAYKALKAEAHPNVTAKFNTATIASNGSVVNANVALTIAGKTIEIPITSSVKTAGNMINVTAEKSFNMEDWGVEAPSFMMGTVKTGKDVKIKAAITFENPVN